MSISADDLTLDPTDRTLLALLRENARRSIVELGRAAGLSRASVYARLERLERRGVIAGYTVRLGTAFAAGRVRAHVLIKIAGRLGSRIEARLAAIPEVVTLHAISGEYDLIGIVEAADLAALDGLIDTIAAIEGVERTNSSIVLATKIER
ncbi:Lrp/AsnC family transcriptional regulator [Prosthecomicrobium pneumaticum]|uniref:DNA-binding Lrp family transcriptional regulator n=1 Tax=Prosthecomicrobium pneumaticum TaxID=81895 RepID=A0A7W9FQS0_9HYPH|nr:Lrp/AsnC family transcriptional regulator [Prosthecomicrobium pneumaticum]MBB5755073.1 DNA-binding Lrp family transcriptional regulator [Prosthecomicrobium pneumaticum]